MNESLSYKFIAALELPRDRLYSLALAQENSPAKAEALLQRTSREFFAKYAHEPHLNPAAEIEKSLGSCPEPAVTSPMPADTWARLAVAIQIEAAKSAASRAINPDSVLLSPDPLLAPKKTSSPEEGDGLDLSPPSRFFLASAVTVLIGIALTIYILTRPLASHSATLPATIPATSPAP